MPPPARNRCFRRKQSPEEEESAADSGDEEQRRLALEEIKLLQKHRERRSGIPALPSASAVDVTAAGYDPLTGGLRKMGSSAVGDGEKDDLVLQDTFAQETAVTIEDPNMIKYVERELAKRKGRNVNGGAQQSESELKHLEDELYAVPEHLKLKRKNPEESSTQWTTGIAEVQLPIEYKLKNIEETEAAKKLLHEKRLMASKAKSELHIPSSYSADYFQRGRDYAEKFRQEHPELYKSDRFKDGGESGDAEGGEAAAARRQPATDGIMLERFRKRERQRAMRR